VNSTKASGDWHRSVANHLRSISTSIAVGVLAALVVFIMLGDERQSYALAVRERDLGSALAKMVIASVPIVIVVVVGLAILFIFRRARLGRGYGDD
jgi:ABC-type spermidine/putrescine transport system permease subunit II